MSSKGWSGEMRQRMRLLGPHIRRAVLISKVIDVRQNDAENLAKTLDGMRTAIFLVDQEGRFIHANTAGNALLLQSDVLRAVAGKVATFAPETNESLREALFAASNGEAEIGSKGISLLLISRTGERHAVHVLQRAAKLIRAQQPLRFSCTNPRWNIHPRPS